MPVKIFSCMPFGLEGRPVEVEADIMRGLPAFTIVGLGDAAVQEAKERIRSAIKNSGFDYPQTKKIINLAPAHLKKHGPQFDLPMAVSLLVASGQVGAGNRIGAGSFAETLLVGELALDGSVRAVNGIITMALFARSAGWKRVIIPEANFAEASLVKGIEMIPLGHLREIVNLKGLQKPKNAQQSLYVHSKVTDISEMSTSCTGGTDFAEISGQAQAKRALTIAAAGSHHIILSGPPGTGKTMLAKAMPGIMPPLSEEEMFEVMQIYSCAGMLGNGAGLFSAITRSRPFRQVHNTCSLLSLTGGGISLKPGEITLAHRGVLFLDEIAEFPRAHIEALRQPLESGEIRLSRASGSLKYPAGFLLLAGMNPCPCGYHGDPEKDCVCRPSDILRYRKKLSGPILDRISLHVTVPRQNVSVYGANPAETSAEIRDRVVKARGILTSGISQHPMLTKNAHDFLNEAGERLRLSGRGYKQVIKVAQTIAALSSREQIQTEDLAEALQYRKTG